MTLLNIYDVTQRPSSSNTEFKTSDHHSGNDHKDTQCDVQSQKVRTCGKFLLSMEEDLGFCGPLPHKGNSVHIFEVYHIINTKNLMTTVSQ